MANMIYTIIGSQNVKIPGQMDLIYNPWIASRNVKIPGQMDLIPGPMVKFVDNPGKPWMVGRYAIAYKNLNKMRKKLS